MEIKNPDISDIPMETWHPFDASKNLRGICNEKDAKKHPVSRGITWNSAYILESLEPLFEIYKKEVKDEDYEDDFGMWLEELTTGKEIVPPC